MHGTHKRPRPIRITAWIALAALGAIACDNGASTTDAGAARDAGGGVDAGPSGDAGPGVDSGASTDAGPGGTCLEGVVLDLTGTPPHIWVCTVPEEMRDTVCPSMWFEAATMCGALGGMFGFYHNEDGSYELRTYGAVTTSHGTLENFGNAVTGLPADTRVEVYHTDSRTLAFTFSAESVTLHGYTSPP